MRRKISIAIITVLALSVLLISPALAHEGVGGDELASADIMLILALIFFAITSMWIIFSIKNGELRNPEAIKFQMLQVASFDDDGSDLEQYVLAEDE